MKDDFAGAFQKAGQQQSALRKSDQRVFVRYPRAKLFDSNLRKTSNQAIYNEYATKKVVNE